MAIKPLVSVNMVTYNHERYIAQAIEGVIQQKTNFPFELVIGEDCSTDSTRQIVFEYQAKYPDIIRVITSENNIGAHNNSLRVTRACQGKYIAYCDGDDCWHNQSKMQIQVDFLEANPDYVLVHSNCRVFKQDMGQFLGVRHKAGDYIKLSDADAYDEIIMRKRTISTLTVCARRDVVFNVIDVNAECFDSKYLIGDLQLWLEISRHGKVKYLPDVLATYREMGESMCNSLMPQKSMQFELNVQTLINHYLGKYVCPEEVRRKAICRQSLNLLIAAELAGNTPMVREQRNVLKQFSAEMDFWDYMMYIKSTNIVSKYLVKVILKIMSTKAALSLRLYSGR